MSKVLIINGSPRAGGNTAIAVREMETVFRENGVEVTTVQIGGKAIRGCIACGKCAETGRCVFDDAVNELAPLFEQADGLVVASPVYYASANATLIACLDRLFHSTRLNKYFTISGMPVVSSQYWNSIYGREPGEAELDEEGRQTMRVLARNMTFLMQCIELGKRTFGLPETEPHLWTHFI